MDMIINDIQTVGEFKRQIKNFVRGAVKSTIFSNEDKTFEFKVVCEQEGDTKKDTRNYVTISAISKYFKLEFVAEVSNRVYNKIDAKMFEPIIEQFERLASVNKITFII